MNNNLTVAQIYGTVGGLITPAAFNMIHVGNLFESIAITILTTTISFTLPLLYKKVAKKYNLN